MKLRRTAHQAPSPVRDDGRAPVPAVKALREYAFIADGRRGALVDTSGAIAWMCFPDWSDPAILAGLLGSGGEYRVAPEGRHVPGGLYEDGTLIWRSRWITQSGVVECRDALAYPGEPGRAVLLRQLRALKQPGRVTVTLDLATDYGRSPLGGWRLAAGRWETPSGAISARWHGAAEARRSSKSGLEMELVLDPGETRDLVLEVMAGGFDRHDAVDPKRLWDRTEQAWREGMPACDDVVAHDDVRRALAVIRGMTGPNGATVAAATTSLPERAEAGRNYDYRYAWVRDTCYVGHSGAALTGGEAILDGAVQWVSERLLADGDATMPAYRTDGSVIPDEQPLHLPGYPGGSDVTGNRARNQFQLDLFGESLVLLARAAELDRLDADGWRAAEIAAQAIEKRWQEPDAGIWEIDPDLWTHSRLICVAGLKALGRAGGPMALTRRSLSLADSILGTTDRSGLHSSGRWKRSPTDERVDASLLLAEIRGAIPADDPRSAATRRAVATELVDQGYVYRYGHPGEQLGDSEGSFLICNFWMALAHSLAGDDGGAVRWFERGRAAVGSPGLFSEEYDVAERQLRGNIPQVFVHALLIEAAAVQPFEGAIST